MIAERRSVNKKLDDLYNTRISKHTNLVVVTVGSKGEGVAKYFESDIDRFYSHTGIICVDKQTAEEQCKEDASPMTMFYCDFRICSPGYTRLKLLRLCDGLYKDVVEQSLQDEVDGKYLRNDFPKTRPESPLFDVFGGELNTGQKSGPSQTAGNEHINYDFVYGFVYDNNNNLKVWAERKRSHDWPPGHVIQAVLQTKGHVVPVSGNLEKPDETEWRICYTEAELILFESLNEFHVKVYLLLKSVSKFVLRPICDRISSYIIKNIIFWMAEKTDVHWFTNDTLFKRFCDALIYLRESVDKGCLNSYMIYERNLLEDRISHEEGNKVVSRINEILSTNMEVFKMTDLGKAIDASPESREELIKENEQRQKAEFLLFEKNLAFKRRECEWFSSKGEMDMPTMLANDYEFTTCSEELQNFILHDLQLMKAIDDDSKTETFKRRLLYLLS